MADFKTHLRVGAVAAVAGAVGCASLGLVSPAWVPILSLAGVVGAIAPDIDSDSGRPLRIIFPSLAALLPPVLIWRIPELHRALPETLGAWLLLSWLLYSPARWLICRLSRHRGSFHSIPAALCFGLAFFCLSAAEGVTRESSLAIGGCSAGGYLVHLILDELYAIDFNGARLKRSFGSALCLRSGGWGDGLLLVMCAALSWLAYCSWEGVPLTFDALNETGRDQLRGLLQWLEAQL